jgi:hypothetical protein
MTLVSEALDRLEGRLQAPFGSYWARAEARFALTEALRVWQALTGQVTGSVRVPVGAGDVWITSPHQLVSVSRIKRVDGTPLVQYSTSELDAEFPTWEAATGAVVLRWAPEGARLVAINPAPTGPVTLVMEGILDVGLLEEGDTLAVGDEELTILLEYARSPYLAFKEAPGELNTESLSRMATAAGRRNAVLRNSSFYARYAGMDRVMAGKQGGVPEVGAEGMGAR